MVFAAGFGTRMGAMTADKPKPLIKVAGRALIDHALDFVAAEAIPRCVVNAHYRADQLEAHLRGRSNVRLSVEAPEILDTGGGLKHALPLLDSDPVFTLNSDAVWTGANPLATLRAAWAPDRMDALLLVVPEERTWGRLGGGDFSIDAAGRLHRGGGLVYTGAQILKTERVAARGAGAFSLNEVWTEMAGEGRLFGVEHLGSWADVGHPDGIAQAETMQREACA